MCLPPNRQICPGTPFAVLRDPSNNCTFNDCPPHPPGYNDDLNAGIGVETDETTVDEQQGPESPPPCTVCTNDPTANMLSRGFDCTTAIQALATRCANDTGWVAGTICRSSCYFAGRGYDGDVCCPGNTGYPTMSPTGVPSVSMHPSFGPTDGPSLVPTDSPSSSTAPPTMTVTASPSVSAAGISNGTSTAAPTMTVTLNQGSNDTNSTVGEAIEEDITTCDTIYGPKNVGELYFTSSGCNYCVCGDGGVPACTALICPGSTPTSSSSSTASPSASPLTSPTSIICPADVLDCGNNIMLSRDPDAGCEFGPSASCPPTTMPPGTTYQCEANSTGIYPVDMCLGFIWCRDGGYVAGPSICTAGKLFDSSCQCCKNADEVSCEVGFGSNRNLLQRRDVTKPNKQQESFLRGGG
mmetsp:Transcript_32050/g.94310  ORF Transcript_32050/g.94310 Transcript_32050/m.94310 type:complete len:411 (-) Transcript_32050:1112-2344(-)